MHTYIYCECFILLFLFDVNNPCEGGDGRIEGGRGGVGVVFLPPTHPLPNLIDACIMHYACVIFDSPMCLVGYICTYGYINPTINIIRIPIYYFGCVCVDISFLGCVTMYDPFKFPLLYIYLNPPPR